MNHLLMIVPLLAVFLSPAARAAGPSLLIDWGLNGAPAAQFNPTKFDADAWVRVAKDAGLETLVITARQNDGFCLWDSKASANDVAEATPFKRDVLRELADGCKKHGVRFGVAYPVADAAGFIERHAKPELKELITGYDPAVVYLEGKVADEVLEFCRSLKPGLDVRRLEPASLVTLNDSRGYRRDDNRWKPAGRIVEAMIDRAGKETLLSAGPTPAGEFPQQAVQRLGEVGRWLAVHRVTLDGPSPFKKVRHAKATTGPGKVYLHVTFWPIDGVLVVPLTNKVAKAYALATPAEAYGIALEEVPALSLPTTTVGPLAMPKTIVVEIEGEPRPVDYVHRIPQADDGRLILQAMDGELTSTNAKLEKKGANPWNIGYWTNVNDHVSWNAVIMKPGKYNIDVEYSVAPNSAGSEYRLEFGDKHVDVKPAATKSFTDFTTVTVGTIDLKPGEVLITLRPTKKPGIAVMDLRKIELKPAP